jgi:hypothetical protein
VRDFIYLRLAILVWSVLAVCILTIDIRWEWYHVEDRHSWWRLDVAGYLSVVLHCFFCHAEGQWEDDRRHGVYRPPVSRRLMRIIIGGKIGLASWVFSVVVPAMGYILGGVTGLAIGIGLAKFSYIPWIAGMIREARRQVQTCLI